jgi:hypothetical protein
MTMTRAEVIEIMRQARLKPDEQRQAKRLWGAGVPRKRIAALVGVPEATVKFWRYRYRWPVRTGNHVERRERKSTRRGVAMHAKPPVVVTATMYTCPRCGCRCEWPQGHEGFCTEWLQQRYRVGAV